MDHAATAWPPGLPMPCVVMRLIAGEKQLPRFEAVEMNFYDARHTEQRRGLTKALAARRWSRSAPLILLVGAMACGESSADKPPSGTNDGDMDAGLGPATGSKPDAGAAAPTDTGPAKRPDAGPATRPDAGPATRPAAGPATRMDAGVSSPDLSSPEETEPGMPEEVEPDMPDSKPDEEPANPAAGPADSMVTPFCPQREAKWRIDTTIPGACVDFPADIPLSVDLDLAGNGSVTGPAAELGCSNQSVKPASECSVQVNIECPNPLAVGTNLRITGTVGFESTASFSGVFQLTRPGVPPCDVAARGTRTN